MPDLWFPGYIAFESVNKAAHYIRIKDKELVLDRYDGTTDFKEECSFFVKTRKLSGECITLHNVCAIHGGGGGAAHWGCSVHWGISLSTRGRYHEYTGGVQYTGGYHEYTGGYYDECGRYHEYSWGVHREDTISTFEDTMMNVGDIMSTSGMFSTLGFPCKFNCFPNDIPPHLSLYHPVLS